jgi:hypothetical protein
MSSDINLECGDDTERGQSYLLNDGNSTTTTGIRACCKTSKIGFTHNGNSNTVKP